MRKVYEAVEDNGDGVITDWKYYKTQQAQLDRKIHMLQVAEVNEKTRQVNLPEGVLAGPGVYKQKWIYKLKTKGNVALRPMVCLGPRDDEAEWTVLCRAVEKDWKLHPANAPDEAERRRQQIINKARDRNLLLDAK